MTGVGYLVVADDVVARLDDIHSDMPWFECRFTPTERVREFEPLFERELSLVESGEPFDPVEWERTWEAIWSAGLVLVLPDGERVERGYAVHVYSDGTARFRH
jgi:hypothetical protein